VVDLAIAANFVRELTEEQFAEQRRARRPGTQAGRRPNGARKAGRGPNGARKASRRPNGARKASRRPNGARKAARASDRTDGPEAQRPDAPARPGAGFGATRVGRTLARLAQVRG
jgi:hypothetical protein